MRTVYIRLASTRAVQDFVTALSPLPGRFDLVADNYLLDAKSLMGIFTLDLSRPLRLDISEDTPEAMRAVAQFIAGEAGTEED